MRTNAEESNIDRKYESPQEGGGEGGEGRDFSISEDAAAAADLLTFG